MRNPRTATKSSPRSLQLEKNRAQQRRPIAARKKDKREREKERKEERKKEYADCDQLKEVAKATHTGVASGFLSIQLPFWGSETHGSF